MSKRDRANKTKRGNGDSAERLRGGTPRAEGRVDGRTKDPAVKMDKSCAADTPEQMRASRRAGTRHRSIYIDRVPRAGPRIDRMEIDGQVSATRGAGEWPRRNRTSTLHAAAVFAGMIEWRSMAPAFLHNARRDRGVASRRSSGAIIRGNDQMEMDDS
jgi:hypothetical protein